MTTSSRSSLAAALCAAACLVAAPALAGPLYSWRTDDGGYAFADDAKNIPPRYRERAVKREAESLSGYAHLTPTDAAATRRYERELAERLAHLRELNATAQASAAAVEAPSPASSPEWVSLRLGGNYAPTLSLSPGTSGGPVVIEKLRMRPEGQMTTRHNTIVRRGDEVLAVIKGNLAVENSPTTQVPSESELE